MTAGVGQVGREIIVTVGGSGLVGVVAKLTAELKAAAKKG